MRRRDFVSGSIGAFIGSSTYGSRGLADGPHSGGEPEPHKKVELENGFYRLEVDSENGTILAFGTK